MKGMIKIPLLFLKLLLKEIQVHMKVKGIRNLGYSSPSFNYLLFMANLVSFPVLQISVDYFEANHRHHRIISVNILLCISTH